MTRKILLLPLILLLFPIITLGETMNDLVYREGLYYKEFTDVPFTGNITGKKTQGTIKNGEEEGPWVYYHDNGQLWKKETYKDGEKEDDWVYYSRDGSVLEYGED
jgi:antitoxin component YwqK of YwqJK toxin-antitoxin module